MAAKINPELIYRQLSAMFKSLRHKNKGFLSASFSIALLISMTLGAFLLEPAIDYDIYTENLNLIVNASSSYTWVPENPGILSSVRISGKIIGNGTAKVYLENKLLFDSSKIDKKNDKSKIIGAVISNLTNQSINDSIENNSSNLTFIENGTLEIINQSESNNTAEISLMREFNHECLQTCNLNLNEVKYQLNFELDNSQIVIDNIEYTLKEKDKNITAESELNSTAGLNETNQSEYNKSIISAKNETKKNKTFENRFFIDKKDHKKYDISLKDGSFSGIPDGGEI